jgi:hypothetical protein
LLKQISTYIQLYIPLNNQSFENELINNISQDKELLKIFQKLINYFNGEYSIDEIIWRENLDFETIEKILNVFKSILFSFDIYN